MHCAKKYARRQKAISVAYGIQIPTSAKRVPVSEEITESDAEILERYEIGEIVPPDLDSSPFNSLILNPNPEDFQIHPVSMDLSEDQIESRLVLARFLYRRHFNLKDRDIALRYASKLLESEFLVKGTLASMNPKFHEEFFTLLEKCKEIDKRKFIYDKTCARIKAMLDDNGVEVSTDMDDFMLKIRYSKEFRESVIGKLKECDKSKLAQLCLIFRIHEGVTINVKTDTF